MAQSFKDTIKGVGEIFIFMPSAIERFSPEKRDALRSFIWPLIFYPFLLLGFMHNNAISDPVTIAAHVIITWTGVVAYYATVWWVTEKTDRSGRFWLFVHVANAQIIMSMAFFFIGVLGDNTVKGPFEHYWILYLVADLFYLGFIVCHTLKFPWTLAAFWAVFGLFISDISFRAVMAVHSLVAP